MEIDPKYLLDLDQLLEKLAVCGADAAAVAGGAIRDMLLQKPIKDIDVFYIGDLDKEKVLTYFAEVKPDPHPYEGTSFEVTHNVTNILFPVPIQLIKLKDITIVEHINTFPTVLSRVAYTQDAGLQGIGEYFLFCVKNQMLSFDKEVDIFYKDKMIAKFPEYHVLELNPSDACDPVPF